MSRLAIIEFVRVVEAVQATILFKFVAVTDANTCDACLRYDDEEMTWDTIINTFPYLQKVSDDLILPKVHPNCRCFLARIYEEVPE